MMGRGSAARPAALEAYALLDVPAGYDGWGEWLGPDAAPALADLLAECQHEVVLSLGRPSAWEAAPVLEEGAPGAGGAEPADRFAAGLFGFDGQLNAFVQVVRAHPSPDAFTIAALVVRPELRGCGVAAQLVEAVEAWARADGARALRLHIPRRNPGAVAFALRSGFEERGDEALSDPAAAGLAVMVRPID